MSDLAGKNIIIGITGCIAAYKIPELIRLFVKEGANVEVILTESGAQFVTPLTLSTVSRNKVHKSMFDEPEEYEINHISLADKADLVLLTPATANIIGKIANGIADDLLTTVVMATKAPVIIAPAMNVNMWENPIVQANIASLKSRGYVFLDPEDGELACGYEGRGRLQDINRIYCHVKEFFSSKKLLSGKKVIVTMGGTREYIDPVRFITNKSSGKMGYAIAMEAVNQGAQVTVISTVDIPSINAEIIRVESANQMRDKLHQLFNNTDILIMAAAVADYAPKYFSDSKIKKNKDELIINLDMVKNPDIIKEIAFNKRNDQIVIGFAAETENFISNAVTKMKEKNLNMIVVNDVSRTDIGMNSDYNEVTFIFSDGKTEHLEKTAKSRVAKRLIELISDIL